MGVGKLNPPKFEGVPMSYNEHKFKNEVAAGLKGYSALLRSLGGHKKVHEVLDALISNRLPFVENVRGEFELDPHWIRYVTEGDTRSTQYSLSGEFHEWAKTEPRLRSALKDLRALWNTDEEHAIDAMRGRARDLGYYINDEIDAFLVEEYGTKADFYRNYGDRADWWGKKMKEINNNQRSFAQDLVHGRFAAQVAARYLKTR